MRLILERDMAREPADHVQRAAVPVPASGSMGNGVQSSARDSASSFVRIAKADGITPTTVNGSSS